VIAKAAGDRREPRLRRIRDGYRVVHPRLRHRTRTPAWCAAPCCSEYRERLDQRVAAQGINLRAWRACSAPSWPAAARRLAVRRGGRPHRRPPPGATGQLAGRKPPVQARAEQGRGRCGGDAAGRLLGLDEGTDRARRGAGRHPRPQLDMVGVDCEVLGFTTGAWNGGRPYRDWMARAGRRRRGGSTRPATWCSRKRRATGAVRAPASPRCSRPTCSARASTARPWTGPASACWRRRPGAAS
jgi:cobaltochelatase CobT